MPKFASEIKNVNYAEENDSEDEEVSFDYYTIKKKLNKFESLTFKIYNLVFQLLFYKKKYVKEL